MFGKIFSQEVRNAWRLPAVMAAAAVGLSLVMRFVILYLWESVGSYRYNAPWAVRAVLWTFMAFYVIFMIVANMMVIFFMPVRFYREAYRDQGYLYHSLPLTKAQFLGAHALSGGLLILTYYLIDVLCLWIVIKDFDEVMDFLSFFYRIVLREFRSLLYTSGDRVTVLTVIAVIAIVLSPFAVVLQVYCAVALGQSAKKHRVAMSFVWYFVLSFATGVIRSLVSAFTTNRRLQNYSYLTSTSQDVLSALLTTSIVSLLLLVAQIVVFFVITRHRMEYHLDLE